MRGKSRIPLTSSEVPHSAASQVHPRSITRTQSLSFSLTQISTSKASLEIVPDHRRSNEYAASNWFDNSRPKEKVSILGQCGNHVETVDLMNDNGRGYFSWNWRGHPRISPVSRTSVANSSKMMSSDRNIFHLLPSLVSSLASSLSHDVQG